jgi:uncharacterized protein YoxC
MKKIVYIGTIILAVALAGLIAYGAWNLKRKIDYLMYEDMVRKTVKEMVKEECLKK